MVTINSWNKRFLCLSFVIFLALGCQNDLWARYLTDPNGYLKQKLADISGLAETGTAVSRVGRAAGDLTDSTVKALGGNQGVNDNGGAFGDYWNKTQNRQASLQFAKDHPELANALAGPEGPQRDAAMQAYNQYAATQFGVKAPNATVSYNGSDLKGTLQDQATNAETGEKVVKSSLKGAYDTQNQNILINAAAQDGSTQDYTSTDGHELKHALDQQLGRTTTEAGADRFGQQVSDALKDEIGTGQSANLNTLNLNSPITQPNSARYQVGNALAGQAEVVDPKLTAMYKGQILGVNEDLFPSQDKVVDLTSVLGQSSAKTKGTPLYIAAKVGAIELTQIGLIDRVILGIDPYTGATVSTEDRINETLITAATFGASKGLGALREGYPLIKTVLPSFVEKIPDSINAGYGLYHAYQKETGNEK